MTDTGCSLQDKVKQSCGYLSWVLEHYAPEEVAVAWTGGKDSTLVLHLWRTFLAAQDASNGSLKCTCPVFALTIDTGLKFPDVVRFWQQIADDWEIDHKVRSPSVDLEGYPVARDPVTCCRELKILPLRSAVCELKIRVLLTGLRHDEHQSRGQRSWQEKRSDPAYFQVNPILHWTEMDVWAYIQAENLPYCSLYEQGYRSLGCRPCTSPALDNERSGRNQDKENNLELLHSLGYF